MRCAREVQGITGQRVWPRRTDRGARWLPGTTAVREVGTSAYFILLRTRRWMMRCSHAGSLLLPPWNTFFVVTERAVSYKKSISMGESEHNQWRNSPDGSIIPVWKGHGAHELPWYTIYLVTLACTRIYTTTPPCIFTYIPGIFFHLYVHVCGRCSFMLTRKK